MPIDVKAIKHLLGDRILIRPLARPEKRGKLLLPQSALNAAVKQTDIWFGVIEGLGRDARYPDAYGLQTGDIVGVEALGRQCETLAGSDGEEHCWVAEEFLACKDGGRYAAFRDGKTFKTCEPNSGLEPLGSYVLVRPDEEEEKRGGIHIPHSARELQKMGTCLAASIGEVCGTSLNGLHVDVGAQVLFGRHSGSWVRLDENLLLMKAGAGSACDVIATMEREVAHVSA